VLCVAVRYRTEVYYFRTGWLQTGSNIYAKEGNQKGRANLFPVNQHKKPVNSIIFCLNCLTQQGFQAFYRLLAAGFFQFGAVNYSVNVYIAVPKTAKLLLFALFKNAKQSLLKCGCQCILPK